MNKGMGVAIGAIAGLSIYYLLKDGKNMEMTKAKAVPLERKSSWLMQEATKEERESRKKRAKRMRKKRRKQLKVDGESIPPTAEEYIEYSREYERKHGGEWDEGELY